MTAEGPLAQLPLTELIRSCCENNSSAAWRTFVIRFHQRIYSFILRDKKLRGLPNVDNSVTHDLMQDVYIRLLANDKRALRDLQDATEGEVLAFLACVARTTVSDYIRRVSSLKRAVPLVSLEQDVDLAQGRDIALAGKESLPDQALNERKTKEELYQLLLKTLKGGNARRDAVIFLLHAMDGLSAEEIVTLAAFNMTLPNIDKIIYRIKAHLRELLKDKDMESLLRSLKEQDRERKSAL
jgi:RNA polymerase sigma factor (sigma-70 family)